MTKSKYEEILIKKMDTKKDSEIIAKNAYRKASSIVKQQLAALEEKRVYLEILAEEKQEELEAATFSEKFSITAYDAAKLAFERVQDELADVDTTLEKRKKLLDIWK